LSYDGNLSFLAAITYFHSYVSDQIVWQLGYQQVWKPVNLNGAAISGHEDVVRIALYDDLLKFTYRNTVTVAKNKSRDANSGGKLLIFRPQYITDLEWTAKYRYLRATYRVRLVDLRYSTAANTRWYDAYRIDDASVASEIVISDVTLKLGYRVHNIQGEQYELIGQYPMPGREWGIDISVIYGL
jgi:outer membrane cobalamin receptor